MNIKEIVEANTWNLVTYTCPYCQHTEEVDSYEDEEEPNVMECDKCERTFTYRIPDTNY